MPARTSRDPADLLDENVVKTDMSESQKTRVLISGGGVAGYTLAYWLHHHGFEPVVIERAEQNHSDGYGIEFVGTGWDVADKMGLVPELERHRIVVEDTVIKNVEGESTAEIDLSILYGDAESARKSIALDRSVLVGVLYAAIADSVEVRFATSIQTIDASADAVEVTYRDGSRESYDLLVGADGYRSNVRAQVFGPHEQFSQCLGYSTGAFYLANDGRFARNSVMYLQPDLMASVVARDEARLLVNVTYKEPKPERMPNAAKRGAIAAHAVEEGWFARDLLANLDEDAPVFLDSMGQIQMPKWSMGRVALVGDAAYCMSALSGQGTSMAMGGAYLLAQMLSQHEDPTEAFAAYEATLRPHIEDTQKKARNVASSFVPDSKLKIFLLTAMMKMMRFSWVAKLASSQFNVESLFDTGVLTA